MPDVTLTLTIPSEKVDAVRDGFGYLYPKPEGYTGTDKDWLEHCWATWLADRTRKGLRKLAAATVAVEESYTE